MDKAVLYTRVSSDQQVDNTSLDSQRAVGEKFCELHNLELTQVFEERGVSATSMERPMLTMALAHCLNPKNGITKFLVYKFDRFARKLGDHIVLRNKLREVGIDVISMSEPVDRSPTGELLENILASFAEHDNKLRLERCYNGIKNTLQNGIYVYRPPMGYKRIPGSPAKPPVPNDDFEALKEGFEMYSTGNYTMQDIADHLNNLGIKGSKNNKLSSKTIHRMLHNEFYNGRILSEKYGVDVEAKHEAIVSRHTWQKIKMAMNTNGKKPRRSINNKVFKLNRLLYCNCDSPLTGHFSRGKLGKHYAYYSCVNPNCKEKLRFKKEFVDEQWEKLLLNMKPSDDLVVGFKLKVKEKFEEIKNQGAAKRLKMEKRKLDLLKKKERVIEAYEDGIYDVATYKTRIKKLDSEMIPVEIISNEVEVDIEKVLDDIDKYHYYLEHLVELWNNLSFNQSQVFKRIIFPQGVDALNWKPRTPEITSVHKEMQAFAAPVMSFGTEGGIYLEPYIEYITDFVESIQTAFGPEIKLIGV